MATLLSRGCRRLDLARGRGPPTKSRELFACRREIRFTSTSSPQSSWRLSARMLGQWFPGKMPPPSLTLWRRNLERSDGQQGPAVCSSTVGRFYQEEVVGIFPSSSCPARYCLSPLDLCRRGFTAAVNKEGVNQNGSRSTPIFKLQAWHCLPTLPSKLRASTLKSMSANGVWPPMMARKGCR